jgi:argininosuccinate lyase
MDSVDILAYVLDGLVFEPGNIKLDDGIYATEEAYKLVREQGVPFRDAYRQVAKRYAGS